MAGSGMLAEGWSAEPYWSEAAPLEEAPVDPPALPARADVAIVGAGFTGLSAALVLARAGRSVLVLDAGPPGCGASRRNGGMVGSSLRLPYAKMVRRYGREDADAMLREGLQALDFTTGLIAREGIDCAFQRAGRFRAAWSPAHYEAMARDVEAQRRAVGLEVELVPHAGQEREVATLRYHGGCIYPRHGGLHPGLFHQGLLALARAAGAAIEGWAQVRVLERERAGFRLQTVRGPLEARDVIVATNGYTGGVTPGLLHRLAPIPSFLVATERLGANRVRSILPGGRMVVESRAVHCYYRPSPDGERILFGARAALHAIPPERAAARLHRWLTDLFPSLDGVRLTHSWSGTIAFTRQMLPALGVLDGVYFAMGYCGSGVAMAPYLGDRIARRLLGDAEGQCAFERAGFRPWPLASLMPIARPLASAWYRLKDTVQGA